MKIILISIGTRGDMEPFLAIGEILKEKGHQAICAFPDQFRNLAEDSDIEFASLGTKFIEMLESDIGKAAMGGSGSGFKKFLANVKLALKNLEPKILELVNDSSFKRKAEQVASQMKAEDFREELYSVIVG
jgi:UDP:flavonoid glycosyltransferase YjiC (YdhE family)